MELNPNLRARGRGGVHRKDRDGGDSPLPCRRGVSAGIQADVGLDNEVRR